MPEKNILGQIRVPEKKEGRTQRVNLVLTPTLHKEVKNECEKLGISFNEVANQLLDQWVKSQKAE